MKGLLASALLVVGTLAGCADELSEEGLAEVAHVDLVTEAHLTAETCETVEEDGPCSLLCDLDALVEAYVPEGACAHFICAFPDGSERNIGVCR